MLYTSTLSFFHDFSGNIFSLATKRVEEGCIHIWYSESVMLQVSDSVKNISCISIIVST